MLLDKKPTQKPFLIEQPVTVVESTLASPTPPQHSTRSGVLTPRRRSQRVKRVEWQPNLLFFLLVGGCISGIVIVLLCLSFPQMISTTIVLFPRQGEETREVKVSAVSTSMTQQMSASTSVQTTGRLTHPAQTAVGMLTLYNSTTLSFALPTGTDIEASAGVHVLTTAPVTLPPSPGLPQLSTTHVLAHAAVAGTVGNLAAGSIHTQCPIQYCGGNNVTVTNTSPFIGGVDSQSLLMVTPSDIDRATKSLVPSLSTQGARALLSHLLPTERLVEPPHCLTTLVAAFPPVGTPATSVHITEMVTCTGEAYQPADITHRALAEAQTAGPSLPTGSLLEQKITKRSPPVQNTRGEVVSQVTVWSKWRTQIVLSSLMPIMGHLVGASTERARSLILADRRIGDVSIQEQLFGYIPLPFPCPLASSAHNITMSIAR